MGIFCPPSSPRTPEGRTCRPGGPGGPPFPWPASRCEFVSGAAFAGTVRRLLQGPCPSRPGCLLAAYVAGTGQECASRPTLFWRRSLEPGAANNGRPTAVLPATVNGRNVHYPRPCPFVRPPTRFSPGAGSSGPRRTQDLPRCDCGLRGLAESGCSRIRFHHRPGFPLLR